MDFFSAISDYFPISFVTLYLGLLIAIFIVTGMLHPSEFKCLLNGIIYLLCLPSGYLVLNIYSIVNITDRSWGKEYTVILLVIRNFSTVSGMHCFLVCSFVCLIVWSFFSSRICICSCCYCLFMSLLERFHSYGDFWELSTNFDHSLIVGIWTVI